MLSHQNGFLHERVVCYRLVLTRSMPKPNLLSMKDLREPEAASLFPAWLIRSKVYPTNQRVDYLKRPSLERQLDGCLDATLSLVCAPAGYGKSTLYAGWRNKLLQDNIKVCWLSLEQADNDTFQLLTYIAYSLYEGGADFSNAAIAEKSHFSDLSLRAFLSALHRVIENQESKCVLIMDNFENLNEEIIDAVIKPLLDHPPGNLHFAIATRDDSRLKVAKLEIEGQAVRLPAMSLNFTPRELEVFFEDYLPVKTIRKIYQLTEGWPVTIQMIRSSLNVDRDIDRVLASTTSSSGILTTYLSQQVFQGLENSLQDFLMDISLIDGISCDLANHLRETEDSEIRFENCNRLGALVLPVEEVEGAYRLHPLFQEYLQHRLMVAHPDRAARIHLRATDWFAETGDLVRAVGHAVQAEKPRRAVEIIEQEGGILVWLREGLTRLRAALGLMDEETVASSPRITCIQCILDIRDGKVYQARNRYDLMLKRYQDAKKEMDEANRERIDHELMLVEYLLAGYEGKMLSEKFCAGLTQNVSRIDQEDHASLGYHFNMLCFAYAQRGMLREARYYAEAAIREYRLFGSLYGEVYINYHLGDISFAEGKSEQAGDCYQSGLKLTRRHFNDDMSLKLVAKVLMAELKYELNQLRGLPPITASIAKQLEEREAWFDIYAAGYTTASNVEFDKSGMDAAESILARALLHAGTQKLARLTNLLFFQRMDLLLRAGLDREAQCVLTESGLRLENYRNPVKSGIAWREQHAAVHAIILLQLREKKYNDALAALNHFSHHAKSWGHLKSNIRYAILKSFAYQGKGDSLEAFQHFHQAISLSQRSGFVRSFIDAGSGLEELLQRYMRSPEYETASAGHKQHTEKIASYFTTTDDYTADQLLSRREQEVLECLAKGSSNKAIARKISVSENTVRFHLKNIFAKLEVNNRLLAVSRARERKLIQPV